MGGRSAIGGPVRLGGEGRDFFRDQASRLSEQRPPRTEDPPMPAQVPLDGLDSFEAPQDRVVDEAPPDSDPSDSFDPEFLAALENSPEPPPNSISNLGLWAALGLGVLGLYELGTELFRTLSPVLIVGASVFFGGKKSVPEVRKHEINFRWLESWLKRLRILFSRGPEKVHRLQLLGERLKSEGDLSEALKRYQEAVDLAVKNLNNLSPRNPENRDQAGATQRAAGIAFLELASFLDHQGQRLPGWGTHNLNLIELYQKALNYLERLGEKRDSDNILINTARLRLQSLYLDLVKFWEDQRHANVQLAGENYEAAAEVSLSPAIRLYLLIKAWDAYCSADPPNLVSISRVYEKIQQGGITP